MASPGQRWFCISGEKVEQLEASSFCSEEHVIYKLSTVYFWNFPFDIFRPPLTTVMDIVNDRRLTVGDFPQVRSVTTDVICHVCGAEHFPRAFGDPLPSGVLNFGGCR